MSEIIEETMGEERTSQKSLRDLYYVFFRHKWKMVLFFLAVAVTVAVGTFLVAEVYRSEARLLVQIGRESVTLDPTATTATGQTVFLGQARENEVKSEMEILRSRELAEKVVDSIGPEEITKRPAAFGKALERLDVLDSLSIRDRAVLKVMKKLNIDALENSNIIGISFDGRSPEVAQSVVAKLVELYLEKHIAVHQTAGSHEFFLQQSDRLRNKLAESENELRNLKDATGISSLEEQRTIIVKRIGTLKEEVESTESELASSKAKVEALKENLSNLPETHMLHETTGFTHLSADWMRDRLYELQLREQSLLSRYAEGSRSVQEIQREIVEAETLLNQEEPTRTQMTQGVNASYEQVQLSLLREQATLTSLQARLQVQNKQFAEAQNGLKTLNDSEVRIARLAREVSLEEANYRKYSEGLEQARIDHALEAGQISNISEVQPATLPIKSIRPRKALNLALGLLTGILGSIGLAFLCEYLDQTIKTPDEATDRLQLPTLASIPCVRGNRISTSAEADDRMWDIPARIRQHYEAIGEQLLVSSNGSAKKALVLAVLSCRRNEGVSTIATNLSAWLAHHGNGDVLLVDANTAHPSVHRTFDTRLSPGLSNILEDGQGNGDTITDSPVRNLHILSAGSMDVSLSDIFDSERFTKQLKSIKESYRFVVVDLPAVSQTSIVPRVAGLCDSVIIVVEAERLRWEVIQRVKEQLEKAKADILGVVLNKRRFPIPNWLYQTL